MAVIAIKNELENQGVEYLVADILWDIKFN